MSKKWKTAGRKVAAAAQPAQFRIACNEPLELQALADGGDGTKLRKFTMTAYTGGALQLFGFFNPVVIDLAGVQVPSQARPILKDHDTGQIVGHTEKIDIAAKTIKVAGVISGVGAAAQEVQALAANGFPWQSSVGVSVQKMEFVEAGASAKANGKIFTGPVSIARQTTLGEVSFVAIGADPSSTANVAAGVLTMNEFDKWLIAKGFDPAMLSAAQKAPLQAAFDLEQKPLVPVPAAVVAPAPAPSPGIAAVGSRDLAESVQIQIQQQREILAAENTRLAAIGTLCVNHPALKAKAISEGWDATRAELEVLRAERPAGPGIVSRSHDRACTLEALQGAMILRAGGRLDHKAYLTPAALSLKLPEWMRLGINAEQRQRALEAAHRYADLSAVDLCREAMRLDNHDVPHSRSDLIRAAFSGSALTNIFTTNVNAMLLATYMETVDTTNGWTSTVDVADFKTNERQRLAKGPHLAKLPRGGTADHYDRTDSKESYKIARYAKQFVVDEQDIIDDSMNALSDTPMEFGKAAARLRPDLVYAIILRNAALDADSLALFLAATHTNLNTTAALTNATLKTAITALEKQRESSVNLGLRASHLIVPPDLKHDAAQIINSSQIAWGADNETERGTLNTINSEENLTLVSEPRLSNGVDDPVDGVNQAGSTSTWYLISNMGHNIEVGYLRGTGRAPQVRSWMLTEGGQYGMGWDVNLDIGAKALDYRGMQKNTA